jgi:hypothetical protein
MTGMRRRRPESSGRLIVLLSSVLALLALACVPVFAQASVGPQYDPAIPGPGNDKPEKEAPIAKTQADPRSGGAEAPADPAPETGVSDEGSAEESSDGGAGAGSGPGKDGGTGQGSPGKGADQGGKAGLQQTATPLSDATADSDDDDSSPLLPIVVVAVVLAAITIGAVMYRQRRDDKPSLSTKAG